jgi:hypothetical protein
MAGGFDLGARVAAAQARLSRWIRRSRSMSLADWSVFLSAALINPAMHAVLRLRGTRAAARIVDRASARRLAARGRPITPETVRIAKGMSALVNRGAAWPMPPVTCLARSLTGQLVLQRRGIDTTLRIGVRPAADGEEGASAGLLFHAWLEVGDVPVNDALDVGDRFLAFPLEDGLDAMVGVTR